MHPLTTDLRALRRGRAVHTTPLPPRLGPALRALCAVTDADDDVSARTKVIARLTELADQLPDDLRLCFTAAFALTERTRQPFYSDRLVWAGTELRRESRTIRRRVDESITTVIQLARARQSWHTEQLHAVVSLAGAPEVLESRRVVADTDLTEITLGWSTSGVEDLAITVVHGGTLVDLARKSRNRVAATLRLPTTLRAGQPHSIAVRLRPNPMHPLYVCTPHTPCATFTLRVIFPPTATPPHALLLDGVPPSEVEDDIAPHLPLSIDAAGHLTTTFTNLTPHLSYGIRW